MWLLCGLRDPWSPARGCRVTWRHVEGVTGACELGSRGVEGDPFVAVSQDCGRASFQAKGWSGGNLQGQVWVRVGCVREDLEDAWHGAFVTHTYP